jgi:hypothetical protein
MLVPLSVRNALLAQETEEVEVALVTITHDSLAQPVRVSSDATQRLSTDPLRYGTVSGGIEYEFILMSALVPDDQKDAPPQTAIVLDNVDARLVEIAQSFASPPAEAEISIVMASAPDFVIQQFKRMQIVRVSFDESRVTFSLSREPYLSEPHGTRMTKQFCPGLHGIPNA